MAVVQRTTVMIVKSISLDSDGEEICCEELEGSFRLKGEGSGNLSGSIDKKQEVSIGKVNDAICDVIKKVTANVLNCDAFLG